MKLIVNGEAHETHSSTLHGLVAELQLQPKTLLIEHNGTALRPSEWDSSIIENGDRIEFIRIVAGG